jgi:hypothetical protein
MRSFPSWIVALPLLLWGLDIAVIELMQETGHTPKYTAGLLDKIVLLGFDVGCLIAVPATLIAWMALRAQRRSRR